jgi:MFS family permease
VSLASLAWIVAGSALSFAAFLLTAGTLTDLLGMRLVFTAGLVVFTMASLGCGLSPAAEC